MRMSIPAGGCSEALCSHPFQGLLSQPCLQSINYPTSSLLFLFPFLSSAQVHQNQFLLLQLVFHNNPHARKPMALITFYKKQEESVGSKIDWFFLWSHELSRKATQKKPSPQFL